MNKAELIEFVAESMGDSKAAAGRAVEAVFSGISQGLCADGAVAVVGHGTYSVTQRAERIGRHPQTGEAMTIAASKSVKFKVGKDLKEKVRED